MASIKYEDGRRIVTLEEAFGETGLFTQNFNEVVLGIMGKVIPAVQKADINLIKDGEIVVDHPFAYKLKYKTARGNTFNNLIKEVLTGYYQNNEAFVYIKSKGLGMDNFEELVPLSKFKDGVEVVTDQDEPVYTVDGMSGVINNHKMMHFMANTLDGFNPVDLVHNSYKTLTLTADNLDMFRTKMNPRHNYIIKSKGFGKIDPNDPSEQSKIRSFLNGLKRAYTGETPLMLDEGRNDAVAFNNDPHYYDVEKIENITTARLANIHNIPLAMLDTRTGTTGQRDLYDMFIKQTVEPLLKMIEDEFTRKLLTPNEFREGYRIQFNRNSLSTTDIKTTAEALQLLHRNGVLTHNELRNRLGLPPIENGDNLMVSGDMYTLADVLGGKRDDKAPVVEDG